MAQSSASPLDPYVAQIKAWGAPGPDQLTNAQIVAKLFEEYGIRSSEASIRRAKKRDEHAAPRMKAEPSFKLDGDEATINGPETSTQLSPEQLMEMYDLNPDDWDVQNLIVNKWDAMTGSDNGNRIQPMYQLKLVLVRKKPLQFVFPARADGDYRAPKIRPRVTKPFKTWFIFGCQQAPYQDMGMHSGILSMIDDVKPDGFVSAGDTVDFPSISRHKDNPEWHSTVQEGIDSAYLMLRDYRLADENMRMVKLLGNHDIRIRSELLTRAERLYGIRRAEVPGEGTEGDVLSLRNLLRLDELNIELIEPHGEYPHAQFELGNIAVIHGDKTGPNAAMRTMDRRIHSIIMAHTHTQAVGKKVIYDLQGDRRTLTAVEIGTATTIKGGLGYAVKPDWINGGCVVTLHENGTHNIELLEWDGEYLLWRDKRYS